MIKANNIKYLNRIIAWNCLLNCDLLKRRVKSREYITEFGIARISVVFGTSVFLSAAIP